ncbi:hypothetical protein ACFVUS_28760 [Nocardia sp. NPDC058058]|uniref:hypothetical protein n=1 Tax=Nocardia sp. NPDC058058 TaxID=3346317 RepID=UPI0036D94883
MSKQAATAEIERPENQDEASEGDVAGSEASGKSEVGRGPAHRMRQLTTGGTVSIQLSTMVLLGVVAVLLLAAATLGWLALQRGSERDAARAQVAALHSTADDGKHAEQVASDYSVGAAQMDFKDLGSWSQRLTANTSPQLANKLKQAASSMEQIIVPLQWVSTPTPITASIRSEQSGIYVVTCFVSVMTKNTQAPAGVQSTATYTVTIDKNAGWKITDVGGIDSAMSGK